MRTPVLSVLCARRSKAVRGGAGGVAGGDGGGGGAAQSEEHRAAGASQQAHRRILQRLLRRAHSDGAGAVRGQHGGVAAERVGHAGHGGAGRRRQLERAAGARPARLGPGAARRLQRHRAQPQEPQDEIRAGVRQLRVREQRAAGDAAVQGGAVQELPGEHRAHQLQGAGAGGAAHQPLGGAGHARPHPRPHPPRRHPAAHGDGVGERHFLPRRVAAHLQREQDVQRALQPYAQHASEGALHASDRALPRRRGPHVGRQVGGAALRWRGVLDGAGAAERAARAGRAADADDVAAPHQHAQHAHLQAGHPQPAALPPRLRHLAGVRAAGDGNHGHLQREVRFIGHHNQQSGSPRVRHHPQGANRSERRRQLRIGSFGCAGEHAQPQLVYGRLTFHGGPSVPRHYFGQGELPSAVRGAGVQPTGVTKGVGCSAAALLGCLL